ncbi:unnamed protein product [Lupinus luteus]|uniref:Secreted protein n=1 Tax=Lupinus luteus TaxID=3873 RepID=A0AAV1XFW2_LUPLU
MRVLGALLNTLGVILGGARSGPGLTWALGVPYSCTGRYLIAPCARLCIGRLYSCTGKNLGSSQANLGLHKCDGRHKIQLGGPVKKEDDHNGTALKKDKTTGETKSARKKKQDKSSKGQKEHKTSRIVWMVEIKLLKQLAKRRQRMHLAPM